jgi:post-segregation antitoxin (ccd killing protein)
MGPTEDGMRDPIYDPKAPKQTVSVTLNSDLYAKAKSVGINASKVAEQAIADEYAARRKEARLVELRQDLAAVESYEEQHGSFPELVRVQYEREDGSV